MGVCVHFWAIPPQSRLFARLQEDRAFHVLMAYLFPQGNGLYWFSEMLQEDPEEAEEILSYLFEERADVLGPEPEARQKISEFLTELDRTRAENPEIEQRGAMLEKSVLQIQHRLEVALQKIRPDAADLAGMLMSGNERLALHLQDPDEDDLGLATPDFVREGAAILEPLKPEELFPGDDDVSEWYRDDYDEWRSAYLEAAKHGEALLVGVA